MYVTLVMEYRGKGVGYGELGGWETNHDKGFIVWKGGACVLHAPLDLPLFALKPWLIKPFSMRALIKNERIHNYRISKVTSSVLKISFLVGPGSYWFQRADTRVLAPMGDNRWFYINLHIYKLKTYTNNGIQPFALFLIGHFFCIQNNTTQKKC